MAKGDPFYISAKYAGRCTRCSTLFKKGAQVVYVPTTRRTFCSGEDCGADIIRELSKRVHEPQAEQQAPAISRDELMAAIVAASRRPCPEIAVSPIDRAAFCFRDPKEGQRYGRQAASEGELRDWWEQNEDRRATDLLEELKVMSPAKLAEQSAFWLHRKRVA